MHRLFKDLPIGNNLGLDLLNGQFIAELYAESSGVEVLLLESHDEWTELQKLLDVFDRAPGTESLRSLRHFVSERRIQTFVREVLESPQIAEIGKIPQLHDMKCFVRADF